MVDSKGLCSFCRPTYEQAVAERSRVIQESQRLLTASTKLETQLSRCDAVIEQARGLLDYERHEVPTIEPLPSELIRTTLALRDQLITEAMKAEVVDARRRAEVVQGSKGKITALNKALLEIRQYRARASHPDVLKLIESDLETQIHQVQLEGYLEEGRKAEFKGNKKKALDQYYEALYYLKHDDVADAQQRDQISRIEGKIAELGGTPPS